MRVVGGTAGNVSMGSDAEPKFIEGEKVLLYLSKDTSPSPIADVGPEHFRATGLMQGKFTLTDDGKAIGWNEKKEGRKVKEDRQEDRIWKRRRRNRDINKFT